MTNQGPGPNDAVRGRNRRSLLLVGAIAPLFLAIFTIDFIRAGMDAKRTRPYANESLAISALRTLHSAQQTFKKVCIKDQDADGIGEYATLAELAAMVPLRGGTMKVQPPFIDLELGSGARSGYRFLVLAGGSACADAASADGRETHFFAVAWPIEYGETGRRSFVVDTEGVIRYRDTAGDRPTCAAVMAETPWSIVGG